MIAPRALYFSDLSRLFSKKRREVLAGALLAALCALLLLFATRMPYFKAEASFLEGEQSQVESGAVQKLLRGMQDLSKDFSAATIMQSKSLLSSVVEKQGHQVVAQSSRRIATLLAREFGRGGTPACGRFLDVSYDGYQPTCFFLKPLSEDAFLVLDPKKKEVGKGRVGEVFHLSDASFRVAALPTSMQKFNLISKREATAFLQKHLKLKKSQLHPSTLFLSYKHINREVAIATLNEVMSAFQEKLRVDHDLFAKEQIAYLKMREKELGKEYEESLDTQVSYLKQALGMEGFLGLAQEMEILSEPKEKYSLQKHQLEVESKRWREGDLLANVEHPWKEGRERRDVLDYESSQITPYPLDTSEYAGIDLESAQKIYTDYTMERDRMSSLLGQLRAYGEKIEDPRFELSALSQLLEDPVAGGIISTATKLSMQLLDAGNWSQKECERIEKSLLQQKAFLKEHITQKIEVTELSLSLLEKKMLTLKQAALELIEKEKGIIDAKLAQINERMGELPEKWRLESKLKMKKELILQVLERLTQLSESKVVAHHLFHVSSKPLDSADAPLLIEPPHFFLLSTLGGVFGAFFTFLALLIRQVLVGLPLTKSGLRDLGYRTLDNGPNGRDALKRAALEVSKGEVVLIIGQDLSESLASLLEQMGKQVCVLHAESALLNLQEWKQRLEPLKREGMCILIHLEAPIDTPEALSALPIGDKFLLILSEEREEALQPFAKDKTVCVLSH